MAEDLNIVTLILGRLGFACGKKKMSKNLSQISEKRIVLDRMLKAALS